MTDTSESDSDPTGNTFGDWVLGLAGLSLLRNWIRFDAAQRRVESIPIAIDSTRRSDAVV